MPACIQLFKVGETEASTFQRIDEEICAHFGVPVDPRFYYEGWYDSICLFLATGKSYQQVREIYHNFPRLVEIIDWLEENYRPNAWYEVK